MNFTKYQSFLLSNDLALAANVSSSNPETYGEVICSRVEKNPEYDIWYTVQSILLESVVSEIKFWNRSFKTKENALVKKFRDYEKTCYVYWINENEPLSGVIKEPDDEIYEYFDLRITLDRLTSIFPVIKDNFPDFFFDSNSPTLCNDVQNVLCNFLDETLGSYNNKRSTFRKDLEKKLDWSEMIRVEDMLSRCCKRSVIFNKSRYKKILLAPLLETYVDYHFYLAANDTMFFMTFPIIAGEFIDGSHEVTVFKSLDEF